MEGEEKGVSRAGAGGRGRRSTLADWAFVVVALYGGTLALDRLVPVRQYLVNLDDPRVQLAEKADIVPTYALGIMAMLVPLATVCVFEFGSFRAPARLLGALNAFFLGLAEAAGWTLVVTNVLKPWVARPRPFFREVCKSLVNGVCTGDAHAVTEARKSFPSGHSSLSFAAFMYLALYMAMRLRITSPATRFKSAKLLMLAAPLCLAAFVAASRVVDNHHNYDDIVAGSLIGASIAIGVWSTRSKEVCSYTSTSHESAEVLPITAELDESAGYA